MVLLRKQHTAAPHRIVAQNSSASIQTSFSSFSAALIEPTNHQSLLDGMVLINLKSTLGANNYNDEFLYETKTSTKVDDLIESLVEIHNARFRSCLVADAVKALATYGVAKMPENDGTDRVSGASTIILLSPE